MLSAIVYAAASGGPVAPVVVPVFVPVMFMAFCLATAWCVGRAVSWWVLDMLDMVRCWREGPDYVGRGRS